MTTITRTSRLGMAVAASTALLIFGASAPVHAAAGGANKSCGNYCPTNTGAPSGNGKATKQPAAGTKGKADSKNPPGQRPNGSDRNRGYECDGNKGIGQGNPAHTGCVYGSGGGGGYGG